MWFAILLGMAAQLTSVGVIPFLAAQVGGALTSVGSTWLTPFALLTAGDHERCLITNPHVDGPSECR